MSNIYIHEPPTDGKVLLKTTVGDIDIELWSKEAPKACRNFVQLCLEGYYDGTIFHRVVKDFIVQGGDPTGTGMGGDSIYGETFRDEFHQRLRFVRRGLVAMANAGKDDNGSQFFFTLAATPELQSKHTIFGKVVGNTLYNMLKLGDAEVDQNERPRYPHKIISTEILSNPFDDIIPREIRKKKNDTKEKKVEVKGVKNFNLLSFGDEAEEEECDASDFAKGTNKSKSSHDLANDPKLSSLPAVEANDLNDGDSSEEDRDNVNHRKRKREESDLRNKIRNCNGSSDMQDSDPEKDKVSSYEDLLDEHDEKKKSFLQKVVDTKNEYKRLKKEMNAHKRKKDIPKEEEKVENEAIVEFKKEAEKYKEAKLKLPRKGGRDREELCLKLLEKFRSRLSSCRQRTASEGEGDDIQVEDSWLSHELRCQNEDVLAKDANLRAEADWFDIYDPRNPINKRRREAGHTGPDISK